MSILLGIAAMASAGALQDAVPATDQPERSERERLICRNTPATGSLVRSQARRCRTARQWERATESDRQGREIRGQRPERSPPEAGE